MRIARSLPLFVALLGLLLSCASSFASEGQNPPPCTEDWSCVTTPSVSADPKGDKVVCITESGSWNLQPSVSAGTKKKCDETQSVSPSISWTWVITGPQGTSGSGPSASMTPSKSGDYTVTWTGTNSADVSPCSLYIPPFTYSFKVAGIECSSTLGKAVACPESYTSLEYTISNTGACDDTFTYTVSLGNGKIPDLKISNPTGSEQVSAGETKKGTIDVYIPKIHDYVPTEPRFQKVKISWTSYKGGSTSAEGEVDLFVDEKKQKVEYDLNPLIKGYGDTISKVATKFPYVKDAEFNFADTKVSATKGTECCNGSQVTYYDFTGGVKGNFKFGLYAPPPFGAKIPFGPYAITIAGWDIFSVNGVLAGGLYGQVSASAGVDVTYHDSDCKKCIKVTVNGLEAKGEVGINFKAEGKVTVVGKTASFKGEINSNVNVSMTITADLGSCASNTIKVCAGAIKFDGSLSLIVNDYYGFKYKISRTLYRGRCG